MIFHITIYPLTLATISMNIMNHARSVPRCRCNINNSTSYIHTFCYIHPYCIGSNRQKFYPPLCSLCMKRSIIFFSSSPYTSPNLNHDEHVLLYHLAPSV